eukprot:SAG31_NODE_4772_length_2966_cov_1.972794_1_plen_733_part_10
MPVRCIIMHLQVVEQELYDEAKLLKAGIEKLEKLGGQIAKLDDQKRKAVQLEDYDQAKAIKVNVDAIREQVAAVADSLRTGNASSLPSIDAHIADAGGIPSPVLTHEPSPQPYAVETTQSGNVLRENVPTYPTEQPPSNSQAQLGPAAAPAPSMEPYLEPEPVLEPASALPPSDENIEMQAPPVAAPKMQHSPIHGAGMRGPPSRQLPSQAQQENVLGPADIPGASATPSGGDELPDPEPLSVDASKAAASSGMFEVLDDYTVRCLFSKIWALREQVCDKLAAAIGGTDAQAPQLHGDQLQQFKVLCAVLQHIFRDRIAQVVQAGSRLLATTVEQICGGLRRPDLSSGIDTILPELILKASDTNPRVKDSARGTLLLLARHERLGPSFIGRAMVENVGTQLKKPRQNWKESHGKLEFLALFLKEFGPDGAQGGPFTVDGIMKVAVEGVKNPNGQTRAMAIECVAIVYGYVGNAVKRYLDDLTPIQLDAIRSAFNRVDSQGDFQADVPRGRNNDDSDNHRASKRQPARQQQQYDHPPDEQDPFAARPKVGNSFDSDSKRQLSSRGGASNRPPSGNKQHRQPVGETADFEANPGFRPKGFDDRQGQNLRQGEQQDDLGYEAGQEARYNDGVDNHAGKQSINEEIPDEDIPPAALAAFERGTDLFERSEGNEELCAEAVEAFTEALDNGHPDVASCLTERGRCYSFLGRNDEALQDYDEAIRLDPSDDILYQNRAT